MQNCLGASTQERGPSNDGDKDVRLEEKLRAGDIERPGDALKGFAEGAHHLVEQDAALLDVRASGRGRIVEQVDELILLTEEGDHGGGSDMVFIQVTGIPVPVRWYRFSVEMQF